MASLSRAEHEDLRESGGLDGVNVHGCGFDLDVTAHLANSLADDRVESILDVVIGSGLNLQYLLWKQREISLHLVPSSACREMSF